MKFRTSLALVAIISSVVLTEAREQLVDSINLVQNQKLPENVLTPSFYFDFTLVIPDNLFGNWRNILHRGGSDGVRSPAIWQIPNSRKLHVRLSTSVQGNEGFDTVNDVLPGEHHIVLKWFQDTKRYEIWVDGTLDPGSTTLSGTFLDWDKSLPLYFSNPWYTSLGTAISNFIVGDPTTLNPTTSPTTSAPTKNPTTNPTANPTTSSPTANPTTSAPTKNPTTSAPTENPTTNPTTSSPTKNPTTSAPTLSPTNYTEAGDGSDELQGGEGFDLIITSAAAATGFLFLLGLIAAVVVFRNKQKRIKSEIVCDLKKSRDDTINLPPPPPMEHAVDDDVFEFSFAGVQGNRDSSRQSWRPRLSWAAFKPKTAQGLEHI